jgi:uncharacterized iron-regulated membrane protein
MNFWERWLWRPRSLWLRRALFQVHLWTGIALGLYVFAISVSGSAIVFRNELYTSLWPGPRLVAIGSRRLTHDELRDAARRAYPQYKVSWIWEPKPPNQATEIWMDRKGGRKERLFDPYTGRDLGESRPYSIQFLAWLVDLHVTLLSGPLGRAINGVGAMFVIALSFTGAVLWWPGIRSWRGAVGIQRRSNWKRFNWQLHTAVGLWMLPIVFMFGVVGVEAVFPSSFQTLVQKITPLSVYRLDPDTAIAPNGRFTRPRRSVGDRIFRLFSYLHFGNFDGWRSKAAWTIIGLAPAFLFITGALMWWNRVLAPAVRRLRRDRFRRAPAAGISSGV